MFVETDNNAIVMSAKEKIQLLVKKKLIYWRITQLDWQCFKHIIYIYADIIVILILYEFESSNIKIYSRFKH